MQVAKVASNQARMTYDVSQIKDNVDDMEAKIVSNVVPKVHEKAETLVYSLYDEVKANKEEIRRFN